MKCPETSTIVFSRQILFSLVNEKAFHPTQLSMEKPRSAHTQNSDVTQLFTKNIRSFKQPLARILCNLNLKI